MRSSRWQRPPQHCSGGPAPRTGSPYGCPSHTPSPVSLPACPSSRPLTRTSSCVWCLPCGPTRSHPTTSTSTSTSVPASGSASYCTKRPPAQCGRPRVHVLGLESHWTVLLGSAAATVNDHDLTVDTSLAAIELALTGQYAAAVPSRFVHRQLADGRLHSLPEGTKPIEETHYVVTPPGRRSPSAHASAFVEFLRSAATAPPQDRSGSPHSH